MGTGSVIIEGDRIRSVVFGSDCGCGDDCGCGGDAMVIELEGRLVFAGGVDAHVHFREPGLTRKADIGSESHAALLGGVTSFIDMPNTVPQTTSVEALEAKAALARGRSMANYGFHLGATKDNIGALVSAVRENPGSFAGVKVFMGSSTGDMKVDDPRTLERIFSIGGKTVSVHAENDSIIRRNLEAAHARFGERIPPAMHPVIRSREACIDATATALSLALRCGTALHVLHVSTAEEVDMISEARRRAAESRPSSDASLSSSDASLSPADAPLSPAAKARITAETTINYLWFCDEDYGRLGSRIKCNPAIKSASDRARLIRALRDGEIDTVGSDHAPHLESEKSGKDYGRIPSGIPSIQFTLPVLLTLARREGIPLERIASAFSERPAEIFGLRDRGRIEPGQFADLVIADPGREWTVTRDCILSRCGWSPYEGERLGARVEAVFLNGRLALCSPSPGTTLWDKAIEQLTDNGSINEETILGPPSGRRIVFD